MQVCDVVFVLVWFVVGFSEFSFFFMSLKVAQTFDEIIKDDERDRWMSWRLSMVVELMRQSDKKTLEMIWSHCFHHTKHRYDGPVQCFSAAQVPANVVFRVFE